MAAFTALPPTGGEAGESYEGTIAVVSQSAEVFRSASINSGPMLRRTDSALGTKVAVHPRMRLVGYRSPATRDDLRPCGVY
jgi:hypothetical protein